MSVQALSFLRAGVVLLAAAAFVSNAAAATPGGLSKEPTSVYALTASHELIHFDPARPADILHRHKITGLAGGESLVGIDYRVARGVMYALGSSGQLYTVDTGTATLTPVGDKRLAINLPKGRFGFDFNPAADRIRVVSGNFNLRMHPDTGAAVDATPDQSSFQPDGVLAFVAGDRYMARTPNIIAAAYTYNSENEKLTTNYAIDGKLGTLVIQGSRENTQPVVSPNTGVISTLGELGTGPLADAHFDISDISNTALAALTPEGGKTQLYRIDLETGKATAIGPIGDGAALLGLAIEP